MGRSHAPYPCRPHHGHPPQNQRIPLLCVTDHSSGHTEEWESLTPTQRATPKRGKTLPGAPGACLMHYRTLRHQHTESPGRGHDVPSCSNPHNPDLMPDSLSSIQLKRSATTDCFALPLSQRQPGHGPGGLACCLGVFVSSAAAAAAAAAAPLNSNFEAFEGPMARARWAHWPLLGSPWALKYPYCHQMITQTHPRGNRRVSEKVET